jgi:glycosyltransferase involved in cell wall biosynthesis
MLDVSVIVPVRNAERLLDECLLSIVESQPREIIVVDGNSTDGTREIAARYPVCLLSDQGGGLPVARLLGAEAAASSRVALIDADVVLPEGALGALLDEFAEGGYLALQAGLRSTSGPGYWGQALVQHHRTGRSKDWFGLVATIFERDALLRHGFDQRFLSGEDIELRWRLEHSGAKVGVSRRQFLADGHGLGRMVAKHGWRGSWLLALPVAAGLRGIVLSLVRAGPRWIPYYAFYALYNYVGMLAALRKTVAGSRAGKRTPTVLKRD